MGSLKKLRERLARLEARKGGTSSYGAPKVTPAGTDHLVLHVHTWATGGSFEDIPGKERDPSLWKRASKYGPVFLGLVREGVLPGYQELLNAGVDFALAKDVGARIVGGRRNHAPAPNTPRQP